MRARGESVSREARWSSPPAGQISMGDPFCYDLDFGSAEFPFAGPISPNPCKHIGGGDFRKIDNWKVIAFRYLGEIYLIR